MRHRILITLMVAVGIVLGLNTAPAQAATTANVPGWLSWLLPTGTLCVATQGSPVLAQAAANWNKTDAVIVAHRTCAGYPRHMTLKFRGTTQPGTHACGWFSSDGWTWRKVRGVGTWTPDAGWVTINYATNLKAGCRATTAMFSKVVNHETGHWLGLDHNCEYSVMANCDRWTWKSGVPTSYDTARVNRRY